MAIPADSNAVLTSTRTVVVVLGMHRSGTSAVAGCLQRLGVDFGPRLMPATADNARGFYEHIDVVNLHDRLLLALGGSWDETSPLPEAWWEHDAVVQPYRAEMLGLLNRDFPASALWGLKDPRLCRLLGWWEPLWTATHSRPLFVIVRRSPAEVAASLTRREGFSPAKSQQLWLQHVLAAERDTRGHPRVFVNFKDFLADWRLALDPVREALARPWPSAGVPDAPHDFVDRTLSRSSDPIHAPGLSPWLVQADEALLLGCDGKEAKMREILDAVGANFRAAEMLFVTLDEQIAADLRHQLEATRRQARWYEEEWQKARRRVSVTDEKLATRQAKMELGNVKIIKLETDISKLRKQFLSNMRKGGSNWFTRIGKFLRLL